MHVNMPIKRSRASLRLLRLFSGLLIICLLISPAGAVAAARDFAPAAAPRNEKVIFFSSDGLRQDLVESYADQGLMPAMARLLRSGARAADGGLLTQAPPTT